MKHTLLIISAILTFLFIAAIPSVTAYGNYGSQNYYPQSYSGGYYNYPYSENTDINSAFTFNGNTNQYASQNKGARSQFGTSFLDQQFNTQDFGAQTFLNQYFQNAKQNTNLKFADGYDFTKGPCTQETVIGNFRGKDNDFTLTKTVCDNIEGRFFRDNQYNNNINNNANTNTQGFTGSGYSNTGALQQQNVNGFTDSASFSNAQTGTSAALSTSFGKGTRIVLT